MFSLPNTALSTLAAWDGQALAFSCIFHKVTPTQCPTQCLVLTKPLCLCSEATAPGDSRPCQLSPVPRP